jgi:putative transposase
MKSQKSLFESKGFSLSEYKRYFHNHQQEHIRKHLRIIEAFSRHLSRAEVASALHIGENTVRLTINKYLQGGFDAVVAPIKRKQPTLLSKTQEAEFKEIILQKSPSDYLFDAHIWTGRLMVELVEKKYQVRYTLNGIYALLKRLGLTHQKAHADYAEADPQKQKEFMAQFEENLLREPTTTSFVFADEFSISTKPTLAYAWAEKNTRPKVVTSEKKTKD